MINEKDYHTKPATAEQCKDTRQQRAREIVIEHNRQKREQKKQ